MTLIDTHCHLYLKQFHDDLDEVLQRALDADVRHIFLPAINWGSVAEMDRLHHPDISFYKMAGIHPCDVNDKIEITERKLMEECSKDDIVGVGETGLDYYWSKEFVEKQKSSLKLHCKVAKELQKPIVLHNRDATADLLDIIEKEQEGSLTGVWHCFTGTVDEGRRAVDMGLYLGIGGVTTFKNAGVDASVKEMPLDRLVVETDAPYLSPEPNRGKRNEPAFVKFTAEKLADLKGVSLDKIAEITSQNAFDLFKIDTD